MKRQKHSPDDPGFAEFASELFEKGRRIKEEERASLDQRFEFGCQLIEAKQRLARGEFLPFCEGMEFERAWRHVHMKYAKLRQAGHIEAALEWARQSGKKLPSGLDGLVKLVRDWTRSYDPQHKEKPRARKASRLKDLLSENKRLRAELAEQTLNPSGTMENPSAATPGAAQSEPKPQVVDHGPQLNAGFEGAFAGLTPPDEALPASRPDEGKRLSFRFAPNVDLSVVERGEMELVITVSALERLVGQDADAVYRPRKASFVLKPTASAATHRAPTPSPKFVPTKAIWAPSTRPTYQTPKSLKF